MPSDPSAKKTTRIERHDDIAVIIFDRPEKRNAMNDTLIGELDAFFPTRQTGFAPSSLRAKAGIFVPGWISPSISTARPRKRSTIPATGTGSPTLSSMGNYPSCPP